MKTQGINEEIYQSQATFEVPFGDMNYSSASSPYRFSVPRSETAHSIFASTTRTNNGNKMVVEIPSLAPRNQKNFNIQGRQNRQVDGVPKKWVYVGVFFSAFIITGLLVPIFLSSSSESEDTSITDTLSFTCNASLSETAREMIAENAVLSSDGVLSISNLKLSCLSREALESYNESYDKLKLKDVDIDVIETNAFGNGVYSDISSLEIISSRIGRFENQTTEVERVTLRDAEIAFFPYYFPVKDLNITSQRNFFPDTNFVDFISSSRKRRLIFSEMFDDESIVAYKELLISERAYILFQDEEFGTIEFEKASFTTMPASFFGVDTFIFDVPELNLVLKESVDLVELHEEVFSGFFGTEDTILQVDHCLKLKKLPSSMIELPIRSLLMRNTAVEDFEGIDFSGFDELGGIYSTGSPVQPICGTEKEFKSQYNIPEEVNIPCVDV
eukprot:snap_masked-scaffold_8-processed-gene-2.29-mRNA-1 protein AED:1.00 eAED:1.00 QI:0/-1/0/0/-1/1/1/0/443